MSSTTNIDLITKFFSADRPARKTGKSGSGMLSFDGDMLFSYRTLIGVRVGKVFYITAKNYSKTTTRHQNLAVRTAKSYGYEVKTAKTHRELRGLSAAA